MIVKDALDDNEVVEEDFLNDEHLKYRENSNIDMGDIGLTSTSEITPYTGVSSDKEMIDAARFL